MKRYLRFGEIPKNEKSINWWKVSLDEQSDFTWALENYGYEDALKQIKNIDKVLEAGVSVFELNENGQPVLKNKKLENLYTSYLKECRKSYIVSGEVVGYGADDEPLIANVEIIEQFDM